MSNEPQAKIYGSKAYCDRLQASSTSSNTTTPKSLRTGVIQKRVPTLGVGAGPAVAPQSEATRARLPKPPTLYKVPHSKTNIASRANGESGSFQSYSRIPLHLRIDTLNRNTMNKQTDVRSSTNTAHSGTAKSDNTVKQTRVGRTIHTPARFVQLVHAGA